MQFGENAARKQSGVTGGIPGIEIAPRHPYIAVFDAGYEMCRRTSNGDPPPASIGQNDSRDHLMPSTVTLQGASAPIAVPKIICIGRNYAEHAKEMKAEVPKEPVFFFKPSTALVPNGGSIRIPAISTDMHHEVEMIVLIGAGGSNIPLAKAFSHVGGYGIGLDMTLRDIQSEAKKKGLPWSLAKGFDTSAPVSTFVPSSLIPHPSSLSVRLTVNGHVRQQGSLKDLLFPVDRLIAYLSQYVTLEAGDIIFTGTPEGVAQAVAGDRLEASLLDPAGTPLASLTVTVTGHQ